MSARRPQSTSRSSDDVPDPDIDDSVKDLELEDEAALRILRKKLPWREWVARDFLRYWYWLAALAVDVFVPWTVGDVLGLWTGLGPFVVVVLVVALFAIEVMLYQRIWPEGPWRTEEGRRRKQFVKEPGLLSRLFGRMQ